LPRQGAEHEASNKPNDLPMLPDMRDLVSTRSGRSRDAVIAAGMRDELTGSGGRSRDPIIPNMRDALTCSSWRSRNPAIAGMCDLVRHDGGSACDSMIGGGRSRWAPCSPNNLTFAVKVVR
jgi:hypothetical protein